MEVKLHYSPFEVINNYKKKALILQISNNASYSNVFLLILTYYKCFHLNKNEMINCNL